MKNKFLTLVFLFSLCIVQGWGQKPFTEGEIVYNVKLQAADGSAYNGTYTFTIKGGLLKKELKLDNGYEEIILINNKTGNVHSLRDIKGTKYCIQMSMADFLKRQDKFIGYNISNEQTNGSIAGLSAYKANVSYKDGSVTNVYYTKDWFPVQPITYERFPDAKFLPLGYAYKNENGMALQLDVQSVNARPVENAIFRIPPEYKILTNDEFRQMSK